MWAIVHQPLFDKSPSAVNVGKVENLDFGSDAARLHLRREVFHQCRVIFINDRREVHRAGRQRSHVWFEIEARAACGLIASTTAGGELHDHVRTMFTDARLDGGKPFRIGRRAFIIIADVDVHERVSARV